MENLYGKASETEDDWLCGIFVCPIIEEMLFRGPIWILQECDLAPIFLILAVFVCAILFAAAHISNKIKFERKVMRTPNFMLILIFIGGIFYGAAVLLTGSLLVPIFLHILWNAAESLRVLLRKNKNI